MIHDLLLAFFALLGLGASAAVTAGLVSYRRVKPEFPTLEPVKRDP